MISAFNKIFDRFLVLWDNSVIGKGLNAFGRFICTLFLGSYIVSAFGSTRLETAYQRSGAKRFVDWFFGLFSRWNKAALRDMAQGSLILKGINFCIGKFSLTVFLLLFILFGVVSYFTSTYLILAAYIGVVYVVMIFRWPQMGIISIVGLAPFLPTMVLAGLLGLTLVAFLSNVLFGEGYAIKTDKTGLFLIAFVAFLLVFGFNSYAPQSSINIAVLWSMFVVSYFLIVSLVDSERLIKWILLVFCTSALLTAFYGLFQYMSGQFDMTWVDQSLFEEIGLRVYSTFENPNVYGEYLLLVTPLTFAMAFLTKNKWGKLYYFLSTCVLLAVLALTYSRGCYLALMLAFVVFLFFVSKRVLALGCIGMLFVPFVLPATVIERFLSIGNLADSSTDYRIKIWQGTLRLLEDFWYMGIGHGTEAFNAVYPYYSLNSIVAPHAHNLYLQIMVEMGLAGLCVFLIVIFAYYNTSVTTFKTQTNVAKKVFIAAGIAAITGFLFQGIFDYVFYNYRVFLIFMITLGLLNAYNAVAKKQAKEEGAT